MAWKPLKSQRPGTIGPSKDFEPLSDKGGAVRCARCSRVRGFGQPCQCERFTPDGQPVAAEERVA